MLHITSSYGAPTQQQQHMLLRFTVTSYSSCICSFFISFLVQFLLNNNKKCKKDSSHALNEKKKNGKNCAPSRQILSIKLNTSFLLFLQQQHAYFLFAFLTKYSSNDKRKRVACARCNYMPRIPLNWLAYCIGRTWGCGYRDHMSYSIHQHGNHAALLTTASKVT